MDKSNPPISIEYLRDVTIVKPTSERILEEVDIQALEASIMPLLDQEEDIKMLMDFTNVSFLTSAALGLLIRISKKVYETAGELRLCSISDKINEIFKITRLDKVFQISPDKDSALWNLK